MPDERSRERLSWLAEDVLPSLIARLGASSLGELEVREGDWRVRLRRRPGAEQAPPAEPSARAKRRARAAERAHPAGKGASVDQPGTSDGGAADRGITSAAMRAVGPGLVAGQPDDGRDAGDGSDGQLAAEHPAGREGRGRLAFSPGVGYYLPSESIATGQQVQSGDVLGHVDVLGVRQEIVAPVSGIVSRLLAQPGEAVEYGQELVQVEPVGRAGQAGSG